MGYKVGGVEYFFHLSQKSDTLRLAKARKLGYYITPPKNRKTYRRKAVRNEMNFAVNNSGTNLDELTKILGELKNANGRKITAGEIAETIKLAKEKIAEIKKASEKNSVSTTPVASENAVESDEYGDDEIELDLSFDGGVSAPAVDKVVSIADGLVLSLANCGRVDLEYISRVSDSTYNEIVESLRGSIYQNPETWDECYEKGWETAEEYLSGNLYRKLKKAKYAYSVYGEFFADNVKAIEEVLPQPITAKEIYISLGSPWIPAYIINDFVKYLLDLKGQFVSVTAHDEVTGSWAILGKNDYVYSRSVAMNFTYGTTRMNALQILEHTLNMKPVAVYDEVPSPTQKGATVRVLNKGETTLALEHQRLIIDKFKKWVWRKPARRAELEDIYGQKYGSYRARAFSGKFLQFPQMSKAVSLYPYQKDAVARIIFSPNTLLAHDVGSGKTYTMIAAGMELKRMCLSNKNLYVVPNNIVGQWREMFMRLYPSANVFCITPTMFNGQKRMEVLKKIRDYDFDAIIMPYSCFDRIGISKSYYIEQFRRQAKELDDVIKGWKKATALTKKRRSKLAKAIAELLDSVNNSTDEIFFDYLGITRLFVDEAHNYKNVPLDMQSRGMAGVAGAGSKKCKDMMDKVRIVQAKNDGGGVVMATGTPITNSLTDAFVMQKYLQNGELTLLDLQNFDAWIGMFAESATEFEIDVDTSSYRLATRFSKFHNLPELTALLSSIADFHMVKGGIDMPDFNGYDDILVAQSANLADYLKKISVRADEVRSGLVKRTEDNMLKITTDGRKAALDIRLVDDSASFVLESKVNKCAENVFYVYRATAQNKSTQLVFCDTSTPKEEFNVYDELKRVLTGKGIPEDEIEFVHNATTETKRARLFKRVCLGEIRVLLGSTFKLGTGVNVQNKLVAIHHLDVPWRPSDMHQREGRILRQGNENKQVNIFRYITEGSFDAYSWQLLETKQRFISSLLAGSIKERSGSDVDDTVLNYAEIKALAVGNPLIKQRVEKANELSRLYNLQRGATEDRMRLENQLASFPGLIERTNTALIQTEADYKFYAKAKDTFGFERTKEYQKELREYIYAELMANSMKIQETPLRDYCGFKIVLPAGMTLDRPYVYLQRAGKHKIEMGNSANGVLIRIDNFLEDLGERVNKLKERKKEYIEGEKATVKRLETANNYAERIEKVSAQLKEIDRKLGVNNNDN